MTFATDNVTVHTTLEAQAMTAASLGIGPGGGGTMCFDNITAALGALSMLIQDWNAQRGCVLAQ